MKASVESALGNSTMSQKAAERCGLMGFVAGNCRGTSEGTSFGGRGGGKILGHAQNIIVEMAKNRLIASFYIIEGQPMDICWGIDLMKQLGCSIQWGEEMSLKIGGKFVPVLKEDEMPQDIEILRMHGPVDEKTGKIAKFDICK